MAKQPGCFAAPQSGAAKSFLAFRHHIIIMKKNIQAKREKEKEVVSLMIQLYCRKEHGARDGLCPDCEALARYARERSDRCPFMENKTFCSNCKVHCYKPEMREKIRTVMRFSGPRMIFYHPFMAIRHLVLSLHERRAVNKR